MEAAIVAALVAGIVTLAGVAANLYIARRAPQAAASLAVIQNTLEEQQRAAEL